MLSTFSVLFPVFALIATGYIAYKTKVLGSSSATELNRFVIWLALPALLFSITAKTEWSKLFKADFIAVYLTATFVVFLLVLFWRLYQGKDLAEASIESLAGAYSNNAYIGFPLLFLVFGSASEVPTAIASIIVVMILFGFAVMLIEIGLHAGLAWHLRLFNVLKNVFKNPLVFAPIAGVLFAFTPYELPQSIDSFLGLLASAASPVALISLGLFLAHSHASVKSSNLVNQPDTQSTALTLTFVKLIVQPLLVAWLAIYVFHLPTDLAMMAIFLAALPTGTGPYMLADFYHKEATISAQTIFYSTIFSLVTLTVILQFVNQ